MIITNGDGTKTKEMGKLVKKSKEFVTIETKDGKQTTYYADGINGLGEFMSDKINNEK